MSTEQKHHQQGEASPIDELNADSIAQEENKNYEINIELTETQLTELTADNEAASARKNSASASTASSWLGRLADVLKVNIPLGLFAFGGPNSRIALFYDTYVSKHHWVSDVQYTELLALIQGVPGPIAAQLVSTIATIHSGYIGGILGFLVYSLPSAFTLMLVAYLSSFTDTANPPRWLYGIQKGLSCATVGFSVSAFMKLVKKTSTEAFYAMLMVMSVLITLMYRSAWIFPVLIIVGGFMSLIYNMIKTKVDARVAKHKLLPLDASKDSIWTACKKLFYFLRTFTRPAAKEEEEDKQGGEENADKAKQQLQQIPPEQQMQDTDLKYVNMTPLIGVLFLGICITILVVNVVTRYFIPRKPFLEQPYIVKLFFLFECFYRYGMMAFGNGSVLPMMIQELVNESKLIPLHQFLNAYAISQFLPGPAFNFVAYLGFFILGIPGGLASYTGIYLPAYLISLVVLAFWKKLRNNAIFSRFLKGSNAVAIGFVVTGIYMLFYTAVDFTTPITSVILILSLSLAAIFPELSALLFVIMGATIGGLYYHFFAVVKNQ